MSALQYISTPKVVLWLLFSIFQLWRWCYGCSSVYFNSEGGVMSALQYISTPKVVLCLLFSIFQLRRWCCVCSSVYFNSEGGVVSALQYISSPKLLKSFPLHFEWIPPFLGVKRPKHDVDHPLPCSTMLRMSGVIPLISLSVFMVWRDTTSRLCIHRCGSHSTQYKY
jgi:hypothetical protein